MERLEDIPVDDSAKPSAQELAVVQKYFSDASGDDASQSSSANTRTRSKGSNVSTFQLVLYATFIFAVLSNSWIDVIFRAIPYAENPLALLLIKSIIFAIVFVLVYKFCM